MKLRQFIGLNPKHSRHVTLIYSLIYQFIQIIMKWQMMKTVNTFSRCRGRFEKSLSVLLSFFWSHFPDYLREDIMRCSTFKGILLHNKYFSGAGILYSRWSTKSAITFQSCRDCVREAGLSGFFLQPPSALELHKIRKTLAFICDSSQ